MKRSTLIPCPAPIAIRKARLLAGLTQRQAGLLIFRSMRAWQQWEAGERGMDPQLWEVWQTKAARVARMQDRKPTARPS